MSLNVAEILIFDCQVSDRGNGKLSLHIYKESFEVFFYTHFEEKLFDKFIHSTVVLASLKLSKTFY